MESHSAREPRRGEDFSQELSEKGWYHSYELPDGSVIQGYNRLEVLRERYNRLPIPQELAGRRVLDIGAWDGWFSFEAERHGADVTAIDCVEVANFLYIHRTLSSKVDYRILDFFELPASGLGKALMVASVLLVLIVELLNSAVEATVDRVSLEHHRLAKRAKDIGSAAVMMSLANVIVVWLLVLFG